MAGFASRREAERLIAQGRVLLNGQKISTPALKVSAADQIEIDGHRLQAVGISRLWCYHKPRGCLVTTKDDQKRRTIFDNLPSWLPRVVAVGRLDFNTEGLLLLTTDGAIKRNLELPANGWLRRYRVRSYGEVNHRRLEQLRHGIKIAGISYLPAEVSIHPTSGRNLWLDVALREGKSREIRQMLKFAGLEVNRLIRVGYGPFVLGDLARGQLSEAPKGVLRRHFKVD